MVVLTKQQIKSFVVEKISSEVYNEIIHYLQNNNPHMWGMQRPRSFIEDMAMLTLYKDLCGIGYNLLLQTISLPYHLGNSSIVHNVRSIRNKLYEWSLGHIKVGSSTDWNYQARSARLKKPVCTANLWIDSTDVLICKQDDLKGQSEHWSGKENHYARRFMTVQDASGKFLKVWGGYSPKVYDGTFVEMFQEYFENNFQNGVFLADGHFSSVSRLMRNPKIIAPTPQRKKAKRRLNEDEDAEGLAVITKEEEKLLVAIHEGRSRVERPYASLKGKFEALETPWSEELVQLKYLFFYACAIYNLSI